MKYIIDHFEEKWAVCEDENGNLIDVTKEQLPQEAKEGDVLIYKNERLMIDKMETKKLRDEISRLMEDVFEDE